MLTQYKERLFSESYANETRNGLQSRRSFLKAVLATSGASFLTACGGGIGPDELPPIGTMGRAALLAPLTGPSESVGQILSAAASLGNDSSGSSAEIDIRDSGATDESAVVAAQAAVNAGAMMIIGPLFSSQCRAVASALGRNIPVVALSNDTTLAGGNTFVFGITPTQSAMAVFGFAANRGIRRIGMVVAPGEFGLRSIAATRTVAAGFGIALSEPLTLSSAAGMIDNLRITSGGMLPEAVYLPAINGPFEEFANAVAGEGMQILGSDQWAAIEPWRIGALQGAWFAAPDPIRFEPFAIALEERTGTEAGIVGGLAFDGVEMARLLGRIGQQDREGLLRERGFDGVLGAYRFTNNGLCLRQLAVLNVAQGATTLIGGSTA